METQSHPGKVTRLDPKEGQVAVPRSIALEAALTEASAYLDNLAMNFGLEPYDMHMLLQMLDNRCLAAMLTVSTNQVMAGLKIAREQDARGASPKEGGADDRA